MFFLENQSISAQVIIEQMDSDETTTESELVTLAVQGDEAAFVELAKRYHHRVWASASKYSRSRAETEDLVQDLFLKIWKGLPSFKNKSPFEHWLMRVVIRGCYDHLRKHRKRRESEILTDDIVETFNHQSAGHSITSREASEIIGLLLEKMDPKDRLLITLLDLEEKSVREASALTGWSESNVKVRAYRARKKMRALFEQMGLER